VADLREYVIIAGAQIPKIQRKMEEITMTINFNLTGAERKNLVTAISQILETPAVYLKTPTYAYQVGEYHIDKTGTLTGPDNIDLQDLLHQNGFQAEGKTYVSEETADETETNEHEAATEEIETEPEAYEGDGVHFDSTEDYYNAQFTHAQEAEANETETETEVEAETAAETETEPTDADDWKTYKVELSDPDIADRMEIISAESDERAIEQAYELANEREGVVLLEIIEMDADFNGVRSLEITPNPYRLTIEVPLEGWNPEKLDILCKMVTAKQTLIKTALGVDSIPIQVREDSICFPWFWSENILTAEEVEAYTTFISLLCMTAKEKKRVNGKEKQSDSSPKFLMRVFLLSLGGIGSEYKNMRRVLLSKLSGSSAWPKGAPPKKDKTEGESETVETGNN
jgi:hypothetical protein